MDKYEIYEKYRIEVIGYIVLKQYSFDRKMLTKTDIKNLDDLFYQLYRAKDYSLRGGYDTNSNYAVNRRVAIKHMGAYMGNYWQRYLNLSTKTGLLNINSDDYGIENVYVSLLDPRLERMTKQMYKELENLYKDETIVAA